MIKAMLVDDEQPALEELEYRLKKFKSVEIAALVQNSRLVFEKIEEIKPDVVFLDIDMPGTNGLELALKIQELHYGISIVFVTAYSEYALESFQSYPLDYILKPVNEKRLDRTINHILEQTEKNRIEGQKKCCTVVHCFHDFEAFSKNSEKIPLKFPTRQAKEMFAYLICHYEKVVTREELIRNIFGSKMDKKTVSLLHVTAYSLRRALEDAQICRDTIKIIGSYMLEAADGVCDYIDFSKFIEKNPYIDASNIKKAQAVVGLYSGAYLQSEDYLWAEEIRTELELQYEKLVLKMVDYYYTTDEFEKTERLLITMIQYNPLSESGNRSLLELYMRQEDRKKFKEQYKVYIQILNDELQIKPDRKFTAFYQMIIR